jgi:hypothetical protein
MVMRRFVFIFMFFPVLVFAQTRPEEGIWVTLNMPVDFSSKWQMHNDASYRTLGVNTEPLQYLYRPGIRYVLNEKYSVATGVAFFFTRTTFNKDNDEFGSEFRTWQELNVNQRFDLKRKLQIRFRSEQRFFEETNRRDAFTAHRFRLRINFHQELFKHWSLILAEEYMQQYANNDFVFDQNRLITAMAYHLNETTHLQFGYMWLLWPQESSQHLLNITIQKRIQLYGKNKRS